MQSGSSGDVRLDIVGRVSEARAERNPTFPGVAPVTLGYGRRKWGPNPTELLYRAGPFHEGLSFQNPHSPKRVENQEILVSRDDGECLGGYSRFQELVVLWIAAGVDDFRGLYECAGLTQPVEKGAPFLLLDIASEAGR